MTGANGTWLTRNFSRLYAGSKVATEIIFDVKGMDELNQRVSQAGTVAKVSLNDGLREIGRVIVPIKGSGPLVDATPKITGKLRRSTIFQILGGPGSQVLEVRQGARTPKGFPYGFWVREGTKPHIIRAKNAKALRFEIGGQVIFATEVKHPGTKPNPYHKRVFARLRPRIQAIVSRMGRKVTLFLAGK